MHHFFAHFEVMALVFDIRMWFALNILRKKSMDMFSSNFIYAFISRIMGSAVAQW